MKKTRIITLIGNSVLILLVVFGSLLLQAKPVFGWGATESKLTVYVSQDEGGNVKIGDTTPSVYPASANYTNGTIVTIEAIPVAGYRFDGWGGNIIGNTNPATIAMDCDKLITATFSRILHTVMIDVSGNGTTFPTKGTYTFYEGQIVEISARAGDGWHFNGWTSNVVSPNSANTTAVIGSDMTITAVFAEDTLPWLLIGGIIDGVLVLGVITLLVLRRRRK